MLSIIEKFPTRIAIELTPICNLACNMCPRHIIDKNSGFLDFELWKRLLDEIKEFSPDTIVLPFWRGESLLHKEFVKFSKYALEKNIRLHISTNGHHVKDEKAKILSKYEFITFSLHTKEGFESALDFVKKYKTNTNTIQASFVECESEMMPFLDELIQSENFCGFDAIRLYEEHTKEGKFGYSGKEIFESRIFCPKLTNTLVISSDGYISRCNHIWKTENYNLNTKSIKEAWASEVMGDIKNNYPDSMCLSCDQWSGNTNGKIWKKEDNLLSEINIGNI
ncbi:Radical SAM [Sulfurimonas denitrificans DSM 1251]|jgi:MoaA/NifB/PqqE/SkfB family radical SAM enzyme|uniref:Radical SAM n=1 Tax=Sulfurimonas denitrificans (strain ATCC 33889 / DSM 1251) TaxID=326298 RepID=Q30U62_SULDN|nr:radical SAM/SPASM domain-containing protein [Sulfurimonas denitrificans]ABB43469.1 Radical SAM [Sulfurimonas denitrificans DSM 1251]MDD3442941.1 radical SAM protein [Sulfurimonas denitrificans]